LIVFWNYRYLGVVECVSGVVIVLALGELVGRRMWTPAAVTVAVVCLVTTIPFAIPRAQWGERYISVSGPDLDPDTLAVIASDQEAASFLIPFFDPRVRWIRTRSNRTRRERAGTSGMGGIADMRQTDREDRF
jgi:hypothetical protein